MSKHKTRQMTINQIIDAIDPRDGRMWHELIGLEISGLRELRDDCTQEEIDEDSRIEAEYLRQHGEDTYEVSWPDHVIHPQINGDASYYPN